METALRAKVVEKPRQHNRDMAMLSREAQLYNGECEDMKNKYNNNNNNNNHNGEGEEMPESGQSPLCILVNGRLLCLSLIDQMS